MQATFKASPGLTQLRLESGETYHVSMIKPNGVLKGAVNAFIPSPSGKVAVNGYRGKYEVIVLEIADEVKSIYRIVDSSIREISEKIREEAKKLHEVQDKTKSVWQKIKGLFQIGKHGKR